MSTYSPEQIYETRILDTTSIKTRYKKTVYGEDILQPKTSTKTKIHKKLILFIQKKRYWDDNKVQSPYKLQPTNHKRSQPIDPNDLKWPQKNLWLILLDLLWIWEMYWKVVLRMRTIEIMKYVYVNFIKRFKTINWN